MGQMLRLDTGHHQKAFGRLVGRIGALKHISLNSWRINQDQLHALLTTLGELCLS